MDVFDKLMLRKRAIIETIYDPLKNISQVEHTRHRSGKGFRVNVKTLHITYSIAKPNGNIKLNPFFRVKKGCLMWKRFKAASQEPVAARWLDHSGDFIR